MCFGCSKEQFIETVLLSTHNICFGGEIRKIIFKYAFLSGGLDKDEFESTSLLQKSLNLYKPSILFCVCVGGGGGHILQTVHTQIRYCRIKHLIRVYTIFLQNML